MRTVSLIRVGFCLLVLFLGKDKALAQDVPNFIRHSAVEPPLVSQLEVRRQSRVDIPDPSLLADAARSRVLHIELFTDLAVRIVRSGLEQTADGVVWSGSIQEAPDSSVRLALKNGVVSGHVFASIGIFRVQPEGTGYLAQELIMASEGTETNRFSLIPFLEGTDVFWTLQKGGTLEGIVPNKLEANIFPHLVVAQTFTDVLSIDKQERRGLAGLREFSYSISATPAVRIRMLRQRSAPVRTPSYMPRGNFQFLWVRGLKDCDPLSSERPSWCRGETSASATEASKSAAQSPMARVHAALSSLPRITIWEGHFVLGHHSNGQDGCLNTLEHRDPPVDGECGPSTPLTRDTINFKDGSFSTNYMRFGVNYSRHRLVGPEAVRETRLLVELEHHPRAWMDEKMVDLYGRTRLNMAGSYALRDLPGCRKRFEGFVGLNWNPTVAGGVEEDSWTFQASCFPTTNGGWGIFARLYTGQDYYNVGFLDNITRFHVGMTFNQSGFFRFRRSSTANP